MGSTDKGKGGEGKNGTNQNMSRNDPFPKMNVNMHCKHVLKEKNKAEMQLRGRVLI